MGHIGMICLSVVGEERQYDGKKNFRGKTAGIL